MDFAEGSSIISAASQAADGKAHHRAGRCRREMQGIVGLDLTQIRYFLAVSRTLNFTRAAEACNVSQPALTRSIQRLEEELGGSLILRERALTQLSELGRAMLPMLQAAHDAAEAVQVRAAEHRRGLDAAPLRLGLAPGLPGEPLASVLREVAARIEGLQLTLRRREEEALAEDLLGGELDVALLPGGTHLPDRLNRWPLWPQRVAVLLPADHPMAVQETIPAETLRGERVVGVTDRPGAAASLARLGAEHGVTLAPTHRAGCYAEAALLVALGLGICLAPSDLAVPAGVVSRPLASPTLGQPVLLSAPAGRPMNRAVGAFVKLFRARGWET